MVYPALISLWATPPKGSEAGYILASTFLAILYFVCYWLPVRNVQRRAYQELERNQMNSQRKNFVGRIAVVFGVIMFTSLPISQTELSAVPYPHAVLVSFCFVPVIPWVYFLSCTPLPPSKSKVRQWFDLLGKHLTETAAPKQAPIKK